MERNCPICKSKYVYEYPFQFSEGTESVVQVIQDCAHCETCGFDWVVSPPLSGNQMIVPVL